MRSPLIITTACALAAGVLAAPHAGAATVSVLDGTCTVTATEADQEAATTWDDALAEFIAKHPAVDEDNPATPITVGTQTTVAVSDLSAEKQKRTSALQDAQEEWRLNGFTRITALQHEYDLHYRDAEQLARLLAGSRVAQAQYQLDMINACETNATTAEYPAHGSFTLANPGQSFTPNNPAAEASSVANLSSQVPALGTLGAVLSILVAIATVVGPLIMQHL